VPEPAVCWLAVLQPNGLQLDLLQFDALLLFVLQSARLPLAGKSVEKLLCKSYQVCCGYPNCGQTVKLSFLKIEHVVAVLVQNSI